MTNRPDLAAYLPDAVEIHGPIHEERWGSVGFRLADRFAAQDTRRAARAMFKHFDLRWIAGLEDAVTTIVSELVTNAQRYGGNAFPAGSLTMWHPNQWLIITVHDKNPHQPWRELKRSRDAIAAGKWTEESGRGLAIVQSLAQEFCGELDFAHDGHIACPGKVARVRMLLPDVAWENRFTDPWTKRTVVGSGWRA